MDIQIERQKERQVDKKINIKDINGRQYIRYIEKKINSKI